MKELKETSLWDFLNHIQNKTRSNIFIINQNKGKIEEYRTLIIDKDIDAREIIQRLQIENDVLSNENKHLIKLHHTIHSLNDELVAVKKTIGTSQNGLLNPQASLVTPEEIVSMVLDRTMILSMDHPFMDDNKTVDMIYNALLEKERYEECAMLMKIKERQQNC